MNAFAFALACVALPFLVPEALAAVSGLATGPKLSVEKVGVNVLVEWPEDAIPDGYALESSSAISDLTWERVPGVVTNAILLSPGAITRYFRLSNAAAGGALLRGTVQTGGTASARPLPGLQVLLVEATEDRPLVVDPATSGPDGTSELRSPRVSSESVFVVTASLDGGVELVFALGPTLPSRITTGGLLGGGYGIAIDPKGSVWVGNFGWGPVTNCLYYPTNSPGGDGIVIFVGIAAPPRRRDW